MENATADLINNSNTTKNHKLSGETSDSNKPNNQVKQLPIISNDTILILEKDTEKISLEFRSNIGEDTFITKVTTNCSKQFNDSTIQVEGNDNLIPIQLIPSVLVHVGNTSGSVDNTIESPSSMTMERGNMKN